MDKAFSILNGNELKAFIKHIPIICEFVLTRFPQDRIMKHFCKALKIWHDIQEFLHITHITDPEQYPAKIEKFEESLIVFYEEGAKTFLTRTIIGDYETF